MSTDPITWSGTLRAMEQALDERPDARAGFTVSWRLHVVDEATIEVSAWLHRLGPKGQPKAPTRFPRRALLLHFGRLLSAEDAPIAALLPEDGQPASRALLEALLAHPRVVLRDRPQQTVSFERATLGLVAEDRHGSVRVTAGLDGSSLPPSLFSRVLKARPDDVLFLWDEGARRLTLLDVKSELKALLGALQRDGNLFPPESHTELLSVLSRWASRVPVAMPRSVVGEEVLAENLLVLRLRVFDGGGVELEVLCRAMPDSPAMQPGVGPRDVHVRRGVTAFHAVRQPERELSAARALCDELPLRDAEVLERPFLFRLPSIHHALDVLAAADEQTPRPSLEWVGPPLKLSRRAGPRALRVQLEQKHEWFGLLGDLSVEGERVELAVVLEAARRNERYVRATEHSYVELSAALLETLQSLEPHAHSTARGVELGVAAIETIESLEALGAKVDADAGWRARLRRVEEARAHTPRTPAGLKTTLRPYQREGFQWLARLAAWGGGGVLADDMGLGKTVQALALLLHRADAGPALVVAPTSVAFNWKEEAARFAPSLKLHVLADATDRERLVMSLGPHDVLVVSYGLLVRDAELLSTQVFATLVFDEAQQLKNATTQRAKAAAALRAEARFALSGTPLENHLGELWSLYALVFPSLLGSWTSFRERFATAIEKQTDPRAAPALARLLKPFLLRRTKADVETSLPSRTEVRVPVLLSAEEWQLYEDARLAALSDLETRKSVMKEQQRRVQVLASLTRLRLLASNPRLFDAHTTVASSKLARLLELVDELVASGQRALVFSQFTSHLALVKEALDARGVKYVMLDGSTPARQRRARVAAFQDGEAPLFLISLKAGGTGLNLTAATNVIHLDPWWNPAVEDQASDRAHRLGQRKPVTIFRLVAMGTIEEQLLVMHRQKRSLVERVLEGKAGAAKVTTDELVELLRVPQ